MKFQCMLTPRAKIQNSDNAKFVEQLDQWDVEKGFPTTFMQSNLLLCCEVNYLPMTQ